MSSPYKTVAIAGASGNLGPSIVTALVNSGFTVTILYRSTTKTPPSLPNAIPVDYTSTTSLTAALQNQDVFISNHPIHSAQKPLIDAAMAAGVKRFFPSEFGMDVMADDRTAELPYFKDGKREIQRYLKRKTEEGMEMSWTCVVTGLFLDWCLESGFSIDFKGTTRLIDDGTKKHSTTLLSDIGKAVVGVLQHPNETRNRAVYVQSACLSQKDLLDMAKKVKPGFEPKVEKFSTEEFERQAYAKGERGEDETMMDFVFLTAFGEGYASDWSGKSEGEMFGIRELGEGEVEDLVRGYVP